MNFWYPYHLGHWWPKILKAKDDRKDIKLLAPKKTTYFLFGSIVYNRVTSDPKIISRTKNAMNMEPTPVTIILEQK